MNTNVPLLAGPARRKKALGIDGPQPPSPTTTGRRLAEALQQWKKTTTAKDRLEIARHTEEVCRRMNNEYLH